MDENKVKLEISYCGVCCSHCGMQKRIPNMAKELKRFVDAYRYGEWIGYVQKEFEFQNFMKGLKWFANLTCAGCLREGGMPNCEVRICCKEKGVENCYFCQSFLECAKLNYQKETYEIDKNYERIKSVGYKKWLKEQEKKMAEGFDNIYYLEKARGKC